MSPDRIEFPSNIRINGVSEIEAGNGIGPRLVFWRIELNRWKRRIRLDVARLRGTHTPDQWLALVAECGHRCVKCGALPKSITKDHIEPLYQGGSDGISNLQPLCRSCNSSKSRSCRNWRLHRLRRPFLWVPR